MTFSDMSLISTARKNHYTVLSYLRQFLQYFVPSPQSYASPFYLIEPKELLCFPVIHYFEMLLFSMLKLFISAINLDISKQANYNNLRLNAHRKVRSHCLFGSY